MLEGVGNVSNEFWASVRLLVRHWAVPKRRWPIVKERQRVKRRDEEIKKHQDENKKREKMRWVHLRREERMSSGVERSVAASERGVPAASRPS